MGHQPLGKPFHQNRDTLCYVTSFSRDGSHLAYTGDDGKVTLWMLKDIAPQLPAPTPPQQSDGQSTVTKEEIRSNSTLSFCLDVDATGGGGFTEEADDDPYNNNFQTSPFHKNAPNVVSSVVTFAQTRPWSSQPRNPNQCQKVKWENAKANKVKILMIAVPRVIRSALERIKANSEMIHLGAQSPLSYERTPTAHFDSKDHRTLWERLLRSRGKNYTFGSLYPVIRLANTPQRSTPCNTWHWNSSLFTVGSPRHPVDVAACRDEDRYGIVPESDAEAAAAMLRTNDSVANSSTQLSQLAMGAHPSQGRHTQTQASTSEPQEIEVCCAVGFPSSVVGPTSHKFICRDTIAR
ncbi:uncharacterized protein HD556DRAFT_1444924 [Suillus plorans]|uniref:Uncharacterized protein n=1 Tax=Suillus plorans TaxID=116603 RepID=A0A9P7ALG8_9AGAM|nr:uncharacterized protein HD556DRAFT_1444924 [Suillus plorans]KAG1791851.1 hypothetical protein HD556DRAFT_1444924 [Suillus plorans]